MASFDPSKKAAKWASKMAGATQDYVDGVNAVTEAPGVAAAAHQDTLVTRFNQAVQSGQWASAVQSVSLSDWKTATTKYGAQNLQSGAAKGQAKMLRYMQAAAPEYSRIKSEIRSMPNATDADRQARMMRNMQLMKGLKGLGKR